MQQPYVGQYHFTYIVAPDRFKNIAAFILGAINRVFALAKALHIGAGSIVTKDIPAYSVAVASPRRVRKTIQSAEEEEQDPNSPYRNLVLQD
ncbi:maltose/galactoside acetyltransferase [Penicillium desertorum]|uniref:Maltose/galactoside acetyltransferase n=1 Tax=Penicillium desertorum TaxID=1303715 RepID=A0A9W9WFN0_9EURO|nr:maltose/galactoside acetyltransferase [Penicillium desertorum]